MGNERRICSLDGCQYIKSTLIIEDANKYLPLQNVFSPATLPSFLLKLSPSIMSKKLTKRSSGPFGVQDFLPLSPGMRNTNHIRNKEPLFLF